MIHRLLAALAALQAANQSTVGDKLLDALISAAVGALVAIAAFRTRLEVHASTLKTVQEQRKEDREADATQRREDRDADAQQRREDREEDRRAREQIAKTFSEMCSQLDRARQSEMTFLQKQVEKFDQALQMSERRQRHMLDLQAAIARKLDIRHRLTDAMVLPDEDDTPTTLRG